MNISMASFATWLASLDTLPPRTLTPADMDRIVDLPEEGQQMVRGILEQVGAPLHARPHAGGGLEWAVAHIDAATQSRIYYAVEAYRKQVKSS